MSQTICGGLPGNIHLVQLSSELKRLSFPAPLGPLKLGEDAAALNPRLCPRASDPREINVHKLQDTVISFPM